MSRSVQPSAMFIVSQYGSPSLRYGPLVITTPGVNCGVRSLSLVTFNVKKVFLRRIPSFPFYTGCILSLQPLVMASSGPSSVRCPAGLSHQVGYHFRMSSSMVWWPRKLSTWWACTACYYSPVQIILYPMILSCSVFSISQGRCGTLPDSTHKNSLPMP